MTRFAACESPMKLASRPVRAALAVKIAIAILSVDVSVAAAKVYMASSDHVAVAAETASFTTPFILPVETSDAAGKGVCREANVETDEGYGVRGKVARVICDK